MGIPSSIHEVTLSVEGQNVDMPSDISVRINKELYSPEKLEDVDIEYSYSFQLPRTPKNSRIFNFADIGGTTNKFNRNYSAKLSADGQQLFDGILRISTIDKDSFKCNLVNAKVTALEDIFGDETLNDIKWSVDYDGSTTINSINTGTDSPYIFPIICYGAFQKKASGNLGDSSLYTSKYLIDNTNLWYDESFPPCMKINEIVKKVLESKGYTASGDIFGDSVANSIYLTMSLKDKQTYNYNYGAERYKAVVSYKLDNFGTSGSVPVEPTITEMNFKYDPIGINSAGGGDGEYNFSDVDLYYLSQQAWYRVDNAAETYRNGFFYAPADGMYAIDIDATFSIENALSALKCKQYARHTQGAGGSSQTTTYTLDDTTVSRSWGNFPVELQLIKNGDSTKFELIHGVYTADSGTAPTAYPHEAPAYYVQYGSHRGSYNSSAPSDIGSQYNRGIMPKRGELLCYDPYVNENFVAGFSTLGQCPAAIKNGSSWEPASQTLTNNCLYNCNGYWGVNGSSVSSGLTWTRTNYNINSLASAQNYMNESNSLKMHGRNQLIVELKKGDMIAAVAAARHYPARDFGNSVGSEKLQDQKGRYRFTVECDITFRPFSPDVERTMGGNVSFTTSDSNFAKQLNLGEFLSAETKKKDFIDDYLKLFNLKTEVEGKNVNFINRYNTTRMKAVSTGIDLGKCYTEYSFDEVEVPSSLQVQFTVKDDECGFYHSVPGDKINLDEWKDYADTGTEKVTISENPYATSDISVKTAKSCTWHVPFKVNFYDSSGNVSSTAEAWILTQCLDKWMIDGYKNEESMNDDGMGLASRMFFRGGILGELTMTDGKKVKPLLTASAQDGIELNYKNHSGTLLQRYYDTKVSASTNYITVSCYLTTEQYLTLSRGGYARFDSDICRVCEISGFDPSGRNASKVKLMKIC